MEGNIGMPIIRLRHLGATLLAVIAGTFAASAEDLRTRETLIPQTTNGVPHVQIGVRPVPELSEALLARVSELPGVELGVTRLSLPGALGFQLREDVVLARPEAIVGGREFAHLHPDGSLHAALDPKLARAAIRSGWAVAHPWSADREGWEGFVMIFTPTNREELGVVTHLVEQSYSFVTGRQLRQ